MVDTGNHKAKPGKLAGAILFALSLCLTLGAVELALRAAGFSFRLYPETFDFGFETKRSSYATDYNLFWRPKEYPRSVEEMISRPPRLIFMGDSCTEFGRYDRFLARLLAREFGKEAVSIAKLGVAGWSSYQGLEQMRRDISRIKPRVVSIYFGWNDHWLGFGVEDKEIARFHTPLWTAAQRLRFVQLGLKAYLGLTRSRRQKAPLRVSIEDYRFNLTEMVRTARRYGITPLLITAPTSQRRGAEPAYLKGRYIERLQDLIPLHESYLEQVRAVAAAEKAPLCDLAVDFSALPRRDLEVKYFKPSGIHLWPQGDKMLAQFLFDCLKRENLLEKVADVLEPETAAVLQP